MNVRRMCKHPGAGRQATRGAARQLQPGFTLIELLVVILIATLLIATVPPLFTGSISGAGSRAAARQLATALRAIRSQAIAQHQETALLLDLDQRRYRISAAEREFQLDKDLALSLTIARGQVLEQNQGTIRFFPDGSSSGGRIKLASDRRAYVIDVDWLTGKIELHD